MNVWTYGARKAGEEEVQIEGGRLKWKKREEIEIKSWDDKMDQHGPPTPTDGEGWFTCPVVLLECQVKMMELLE